MKIENFIGTKSWRKFLEGPKRKVDIFIGTKNIFNPKINNHNWDMEIRISNTLMPHKRQVINEHDTSAKLMGDQKISLTFLIGGSKNWLKVQKMYK